jgi:hypothetical protein
MLSIIPGIYISLKFVNKIYNILPLSYILVCICNLLHCKYPGNNKILRLTFISYNITCAIHSVHLHNTYLPLYFIYLLFSIFNCLNLQKKKQLYLAYSITATNILLASPFNDIIFINWIKVFLLFMLSRKHPYYLFDVFLNLLCHSNVYSIWKNYINI